jgi:hypothetical protein
MIRDTSLVAIPGIEKTDDLTNEKKTLRTGFPGCRNIHCQNHTIEGRRNDCFRLNNAELVWDTTAEALGGPKQKQRTSILVFRLFS